MAESILIPWQFATAKSTQTSVLPNGIKLTVFVANLLLIVALRLIDRNYQVFQNAAATRARVLEKVLNLELTDIISIRYDGSNVRGYVTWLYGFFVLGVAGIGTAVLVPDVLSLDIVYMAILWVSVAFALYFVRRFGKTVEVSFPFGEIDWSLETLECESGEKAGLTLTNLNKENGLMFKPGCMMWQIRKTEDNSLVASWPENKSHRTSILIGKDDHHTWLWDTKGVDDGIYQVYRAVLKKDTCKKLQMTQTDRGSAYLVPPNLLTEKTLEPLSRKIRVKADETEQLFIKKVTLVETKTSSDTFILKVYNCGSNSVIIDNVKVNDSDEVLEGGQAAVDSGSSKVFTVRLSVGHELEEGAQYRIELKSVKGNIFDFEGKA